MGGGGVTHAITDNADTNNRIIAAYYKNEIIEVSVKNILLIMN